MSPSDGLSIDVALDLFPFGIILDWNMSIHSVGRSAKRLAASLRSGQQFTSEFEVLIPEHLTLDAQWISASLGKTFAVLRHRESAATFRGGFYPVQGNLVAFLCSIWVTASNDAVVKGLKLSDFSVMDPMMDMLMVLQFNAMALSDIKLSEESLKKKNHELRMLNIEISKSRYEINLLMDSFDDVCVISSTRLGVVTHWSYSAKRMFDKTKDEVSGTSIWALFPKALDNSVIDWEKELASGTTEFKVIANAGDSLHFPAAVTVKTLKSSEQQGYSIIVRNIANELKSQEQLEHLRKMETIGEIAGGLAHNFSNMMGVITGSLDLLAESLTIEDEYDRETFAIVRNAASEAAEVTQALLSYTRKSPSLKRLCDINELLAGMAKLIRSMFKNYKHFEIALSDQPIWIELDQQSFKTSVINLLMNARDATDSQTGEVRVCTRIEQDDSGSGFAVIEVVDNGIGIDEENLSRVTDPFFTTKAIGKGTGLGLSMVKGFVESAGGALQIRSKKGVGTEIQLHLPCVTTTLSVVASHNTQVGSLM